MQGVQAAAPAQTLIAGGAASLQAAAAALGVSLAAAPAPPSSNTFASALDSTASRRLHALPLQAVEAIALATAAVTVILLCSMRRCRAYLCLAVPLASCHPVHILLPWA